MEVDLQANVCELTPSVDRALVLAAVGTAVRAAGFRPGRVFVRARGQLHRETGGQQFVIDGWQRPIAVRGQVTSGEPLQAIYHSPPEEAFEVAAWPGR